MSSKGKLDSSFSELQKPHDETKNSNEKSPRELPESKKQTLNNTQELKEFIKNEEEATVGGGKEGQQDEDEGDKPKENEVKAEKEAVE